MSPTSARYAAELPEQFSPPTIYRQFTDACAVKQAFLDHVKKTNEPEAFPGLSHTKPPTKDAVFLLVVDEFDVDPAKRPEADLIRCAACATKKKFRRGSLAWYPMEGVLRVVGNECGDVRRAEANAEYNRRNTLKVLSDFLWDRLPLVPSLISRGQTIRAAAEHAQELSLQLKTQARSFCEFVLTALKEGDGHLQIFLSEVDERVTDRSRRIAVATPVGVDFLRPKFTPLRRLDEALLGLKRADRGAGDAALEWLCEHSDDLEILSECHRELSVGLEKLGLAERMVGDALSFLSQSNLAGIDSWSDQARNNALRAVWDPVRVIFNGPPRRGSRAKQATVLKPNWKLLETVRAVS